MSYIQLRKEFKIVRISCITCCVITVVSWVCIPEAIQAFKEEKKNKEFLGNDLRKEMAELESKIKSQQQSLSINVDEKIFQLKRKLKIKD